MNKLKPWEKEDKMNWFKDQVIKRSYFLEVVSKIKTFNHCLVSEYGVIQVLDTSYPVYFISPLTPDSEKLNVLITGGVHGYETSGVHGALEFIINHYEEYSEHFNIYVAPCISPWAYETINRWNSLAIDPNRSFYDNSPCLESKLLMECIKELNLNFLCHIDLHETTDTDNTVFRPALELRDGIKQEIWDIPDGFYLVADKKRQAKGFQEAIIREVKKVTHIAPSDINGKIIGEETINEGVICYDVKLLNLCTGFTNASFNTTTEVYPDSAKINGEECVKAQVRAINSGLDYLLKILN